MQEEPKVLRLAPGLENKELEKNQVNFDGNIFELKLCATNCGVDASFVLVTKEDVKREVHPLMQIFGDPNVLIKEHIHPKGWWKLVGRTVDKEIAKFVRRVQRDAANYAKNKEAITRFLQ